MRPGWTDLGELRQVMDSTQSGPRSDPRFPHHATPFRAPDESVVDVIARYNRAMSDDLAAQGDGRFFATATIDPVERSGSIAQLERDLGLPHVRGIALLTNYGDITLDDPRFIPIFELARAFDVPCTVHPGSAWPSWRDAARLGESAFLQSGLGYFLADALASCTCVTRRYSNVSRGPIHVLPAGWRRGDLLRALAFPRRASTPAGLCHQPTTAGVGESRT